MTAEDGEDFALRQWNVCRQEVIASDAKAHVAARGSRARQAGVDFSDRDQPR